MSLPVVIIGAGVGGMACAIELAAAGLPVVVLEKEARCGGKIRQVHTEHGPVDSGPTVFTMRWVFDALFRSAGCHLDEELNLTKLDVLARHSWESGHQLDLHADLDRSTDAIAMLSGREESLRFRAFSDEVGKIFKTLRDPFLCSEKTGPLGLAMRIGPHRLDRLLGIRPFQTMWSGLGRHFKDPRLRQLFGRYATYNGASPFSAPATLMLIAHVEQDGVWSVGGGMQSLAIALRRIAEKIGVKFRFDTSVTEIVVGKRGAEGVSLASGEVIHACSVVSNADPVALNAGLFGAGVQHAVKAVPLESRSLSAVTWSFAAHVSGFDLSHHNVFFSSDYRAEFDDLFKGRRLPRAPTVYVCAPPGDAEPTCSPQVPRRLLVLINAPPTGDSRGIAAEDIASCATRTFNRLERAGLAIQFTAQTPVQTTPSDFNRLFPGTGGALYGRVPHGWKASFQRPSSRTRIPNLYLVGGATHPGAGVPMAALSGQLGARRLLADLDLMSRSRLGGMSGGISTRRATTVHSQSR